MRNVFMCTVAVFLVSFMGHAWAANYSDPVDGIFKGIYGNTISVQVPSEVSKSPVSTDNAAGDLTFSFDSNTAYNNFSQLSELKVGDPVRVQYAPQVNDRDKQLAATSITKLVNEASSNNGRSTTVVTTPTPAGTVTTTTTKTSP